MLNGHKLTWLLGQDLEGQLAVPRGRWAFSWRSHGSAQRQAEHGDEETERRQGAEGRLFIWQAQSQKELVRREEMSRASRDGAVGEATCFGRPVGGG